MKEKTKILVVAAHPDDEILGCGGTIAKFVKEGHEVCIAILGEGITSRYQKREIADQTLVQGLRNRCKHVAKLMGVKNLFLFDLPDTYFSAQAT